MPKLWVFNETNGPVVRGGKLLAPGEGVFVEVAEPTAPSSDVEGSSVMAASADVESGRLVSFAGAHATVSTDVKGVSLRAARMGAPFEALTVGVGLVVSAEVITAGGYVKPAADGSGRAAVGSSTDNCGRAETTVSAAGEVLQLSFAKSGSGGGGGGGGSTTFAALTDAASVNLPVVNTPLAAALAAVGLGTMLPLLAGVDTGTVISATEGALNSVLLPAELWRVGGGVDIDLVLTVAGTGTSATKNGRMRLDNATSGSLLATLAIALASGSAGYRINLLCKSLGASGSVKVTVVGSGGAVSAATVVLDTTVAHTLFVTGQGTATEGLLLDLLSCEAV